jgi:uncharacterized protein
MIDSPSDAKPRRIRDPIHDLIEFEGKGFERMAWSLLETKEFQRLRRIRQLGFSELVFPGATHSRFAHSVGVFHTARQLTNHIERKHGQNDDRSRVAMAAALVHDVGHGPFSHAFEAAGGEVPGLVLGRKAFQAAEAYVLGLFHLYFAVYFHKTTRSAEKMLTGLLLRVGELIQNGNEQDCGLSHDHPLLSFINSGTVSDYLRLDDFVLWAAFQDMLKAKDSIVGELAARLLHRKPYKAIEISAHFERRGGDAAVATFKGRLNAAQRAGEIGSTEVFSDTASRTPYKRESFETPAALSKVLIRLPDGTGMQDLRDSSSVVRALEEKSVYRLYVRDEEAKAKVDKLIRGI